MYLPANTLLHAGTYRIVRFISSGGFGCTYEAEHVLLRKRVAIKEFFVKDFCNRDETTAHITVGTQSKKGLVEKLRRKFIDEACALSQLQHPGIVSVSDVFEENGTAYFVMDYIEGRSLGDIVNQEGPLSEERAVRYIRQVADALQYVHDNNRLHLDIKPGNIMIDRNDRPVLIDFGASKQYDELDGENTSTLMGKTPGYAPPEQMSNSVVKFLPATDIYALGATLYKLLTGVTPPDAFLRISGQEELEDLPSTISPLVQKATKRAMAIKSKDRPQTLREMLMIFDGPTANSFNRVNPSINEDETTIFEAEAVKSQNGSQVPPKPNTNKILKIIEEPEDSIYYSKKNVPKEPLPKSGAQPKSHISSKSKSQNLLLGALIVVPIFIFLIVAFIQNKEYNTKINPSQLSLQESAPSTTFFNGQYVGAIGSYLVHMDLHFQPDYTVVGSYYYDSQREKGNLNTISLKGTYHEKRSEISLTEYGPNGQKIGTFEGNFDSKTCRLSGTYFNLNSGKTYSLELIAE